jgi:hypothetical protein
MGINANCRQDRLGVRPGRPADIARQRCPGGRVTARFAAVHESVYGPKASFRDNSAYGRHRGQSGRTDFMSRYLELFQAACIAPRESGY